MGEDRLEWIVRGVVRHRVETSINNYFEKSDDEGKKHSFLDCLILSSLITLVFLFVSHTLYLLILCFFFSFFKVVASLTRNSSGAYPMFVFCFVLLLYSKGLEQ